MQGILPNPPFSDRSTVSVCLLLDLFVGQLGQLDEIEIQHQGQELKEGEN